METSKQRTLKQNHSIHALYEDIAKQLNEQGYDMKKTLKQSVEIPWTKEMVKEHLWRPIQKIQLGKESTTKLTTKEVNEVYETLARHLAQRIGIVIEMPSE